MHVVVWTSVFHMCESLKFEGGSMVAMAPRQYLPSGTVSVLLCNKALGTSCSLAVKAEAV